MNTIYPEMLPAQADLIKQISFLRCVPVFTRNLVHREVISHEVHRCQPAAELGSSASRDPNMGSDNHRRTTCDVISLVGSFSRRTMLC